MQMIRLIKAVKQALVAMLLRFGCRERGSVALISARAGGGQPDSLRAVKRPSIDLGSQGALANQVPNTHCAGAPKSGQQLPNLRTTSRWLIAPSRLLSQMDAACPRAAAFGVTAPTLLKSAPVRDQCRRRPMNKRARNRNQAVNNPTFQRTDMLAKGGNAGAKCHQANKNTEAGNAKRCQSQARRRN